MPYTYRGCPYYKNESTTQLMPQEMYEERLRAAKPEKFAWERQVADGVTLADLDEERIRRATKGDDSVNEGVNGKHRDIKHRDRYCFKNED